MLGQRDPVRPGLWKRERVGAARLAGVLSLCRALPGTGGCSGGSCAMVNCGVAGEIAWDDGELPSDASYRYCLDGECMVGSPVESGVAGEDWSIAPDVGLSAGRVQ